MTELKVETIIPMEENEYWELMYTTKFDSFYAKAIGIKATEELESWKEGEVIVRKVKVVPGVELPSALLWYLGQEELHYHDTQWKDHEKREVRFKTKPPIYEDILHFEGCVTLEPIDDKTCKQTLIMTVRVDAWGVGGMIESAIASELEAKYALAPKAVEAWIESKNGGENKDEDDKKEQDQEETEEKKQENNEEQTN